MVQRTQKNQVMWSLRDTTRVLVRALRLEQGNTVLFYHSVLNERGTLLAKIISGFLGFSVGSPVGVHDFNQTSSGG